MAKITFVYPDCESLGLEYLMAVCKKAGHDVELVFYFSGQSYIDLRKRLTVDFRDVAKTIAETKPEIVGFSCVSENYQMQLQCARNVKAIMPDVFTVFGGFHPTAVPETVLKEESVDCVAIGEAEVSFIEFLTKCDFQDKTVLPEGPTDGIVFKYNNTYIGQFIEGQLADLNALPFPYKKPFHEAFRFLSDTYSVMTSRGCPYSCSYCFNSFLHKIRGGRLVRRRSVDNVISELVLAKKNNRCEYVWFHDDCFTGNEKWLLEFCDRYRQEVNIPFGCSTIPSYLNTNKTNALRNARCHYVQLGIQSVNEGFCRDVLLRKADNAQSAEAISMVRRAGMVVTVDHMLAIPGDTVEFQEEAVLYYKQHRPHEVSTFFLSYLPKTKIVDSAYAKGILNDNDINDINEGRQRWSREAKDMSINDTKSLNGLIFLLQNLPILPNRVVNVLVKRKLYRKIPACVNSIVVKIILVLLRIAIQRNGMRVMRRKYWPLIVKQLSSSTKIVRAE